MGKKDPAKGGVYPNAWHIPGGGMEPTESLEDTAIREGMQEVRGLKLNRNMLVKLPITGSGATVKTLESGERVWCKMEFNYFEVHLNESAIRLSAELKPGDDLVELEWFSREEIPNILQIPGGQDFFIKAGYMDPQYV